MILNSPKRLKKIYLDYAAATPLDKKVFASMAPFYREVFANPSGLYGSSIKAKEAVEKARLVVAEFLGTQKSSVYFTSGGTESINTAILGVANSHKKGHIITTKIEHHAVLNTIKHLEKTGFEITYLNVDSYGRISVEEFKKALREDTILVSVMYANNEIGTILPVAELGREILKWRKKNNTVFPFFHSDACQAAGYLEIAVEKLHVDLLSFSGSKLYGPKGVGVLYKRTGVTVEPLMHGGGQEMNLRSGTENVPAIVGMAKAIELVSKFKKKELERLSKLQKYFWEGLEKSIPGIKLNGPILLNRLVNNLNVSLPNIDAETAIIYLSEKMIECSAGSACNTDSNEISHVLLAIGLLPTEAEKSIRFTMGRETKKSEIDYAILALKKICEKFRHNN